MTTAHAPLPPFDVSGTKPVPFRRLVEVEGRKMLDTRGGLWLMIITAVLIVLTMALTLLIVVLNDFAITASDLSGIMVIPLSLLLPVFAILAVTSEWSQRTALVTFTQEPHRMRVILAKLVMVVVLALSTIAIAIVLGALGNVLYGALSDNDTVWNLETGTFGWTILNQLLYFVMAFAFGMFILSTPGSITIYYIVALLLPLLVYSTLYAIFDWARDVIPWVDINYAMAPFLNPDESAEGMDYVRVAVTIAIWVALPLVLGALRIRRAEVK